jgi:hypothetical protein
VRERIFQTNGGDTPDPSEGLLMAGGRVHDLPARVKKIATTDDGKLQIVLEGDVIRSEEQKKIHDLFLIQQGRVFVDFTPEQGELDL